MNYAKIIPLDVANGTGIRVSFFVSGCPHHCFNCFNQETWDESYGQPYTKDTEEKIIKFLHHPHVRGLTLLGGEPFTIEHQRILWPLLHRIKQELPQKDIWGYTGYLIDDLLPVGRAYCEVTTHILQHLDMLVDGPFVEAKKDLRLNFRGSSNQRLIDKKQLLEYIANKQ